MGYFILSHPVEPTVFIFAADDNATTSDKLSFSTNGTTLNGVFRGHVVRGHAPNGHTKSKNGYHS